MFLCVIYNILLHRESRRMHRESQRGKNHFFNLNYGLVIKQLWSNFYIISSFPDEIPIQQKLLYNNKSMGIQCFHLYKTF